MEVETNNWKNPFAVTIGSWTDRNLPLLLKDKGQPSNTVSVKFYGSNKKPGYTLINLVKIVNWTAATGLSYTTT